MDYDEIVKIVEALDYRDKLRLAQLLIQLGRKEEEEQRPAERESINAQNVELIQYVTERLLKLRPNKKTSLVNSIAAMFQFQGSILEADIENIITELQKKRIIYVDENSRVSYSD